MKTPMRSIVIAALCLGLAGAGCGQQNEKAAEPQAKESPAPAKPAPPPPARTETPAPEVKKRDSHARKHEERQPRYTPPPAFGEATPYIGVVTAEVPEMLATQLGLEENFGVLVEEVMPGSPAEKAGVQRFDVITQLNDQRIANPEQLAQLVRREKKGAGIALRVLRRGSEQTVKLAVDERVMPPFEAARGFRRFGPWWDEREDRPWLGERQRERREDRPENIDEMFERMDRFQDDLQKQQETFQQRMRELQDLFRRHMHEYQDRFREWNKEPQGQGQPAPAQPKPDSSSWRKGPAGPQQTTTSERRRVAVNVRVPGGATAQSVVEREDESGAYRLERTADGSRNFSVRARDGKIQSWPLNSDEQRQAVPEELRKKLLEMDNIKVDVGPGGAPVEPPKPKTRI